MSQFNLIDNRPESLINDVHDKQVKILARGPRYLTCVDVIDEKFKTVC